MEKEIVNDTITVTNALLNVGSSVLTQMDKHKELCAKLATIVACGELVRVVISLSVPGKPDPVMERFNELERKIAQLSDKISNQFDELQAFVSEHHFYAEIAQTASTLTKFLRDTMTSPSDYTIGNFWNINQKLAPIECAYKMISLLEQEATNPLKMAMKADKLKTTVTFNKWKNIFNDILSQFLYLECMVSGMFMNKNMDGPNLLAKRIAEFHALVEEWSNQYKKNYWPETISTLIYETQDNYTHVGNAWKADYLQKEMDKIMTDDSFYIIVYNDCGTFEQHSFLNVGDNFFFSFRRGKCNMVVYRSQQMNNGLEQTKEDLLTMEREVESCRHDTLPPQSNFYDFPGQLMNTRISNTGFVGMIRDGHNPQFRSVNSWREWGPGWWIKAHVSLHQNPRFNDGQVPAFWLIAGYK